MLRPEAGLLCCLCVATMLLPPCTPLGGEGRLKLPCSMDALDNSQCGQFERCQQQGNDGICTCKIGYEEYAGKCAPMPSPAESGSREHDTLVDEKGGSSVAAILLIPTCLMLIGALAYFGARRYKWVQRFRQFRQNRYGSVLVTRDDTDDDDPPLA